jgi:hypothetical protein
MAEKFALLVATDIYQDQGLRKLQAPSQDADDFARVLSDSRIGDFQTTVLKNEPSHIVGREVGKFYRDRSRDDLALFYFTGHGLKDDNGRLYLATVDTDRNNMEWTSIPASKINDSVDESTSRQKLVVLDCCYSGAYLAGSSPKGDPKMHTLEKFKGRDRVVLTASDSASYSFEGDSLTGQGIMSQFTRYLVEGLNTGNADLNNDGKITHDELFNYVSEKVRNQKPPQRPRMNADVESEIVIAQNVAFHNSSVPRIGSFDFLITPLGPPPKQFKDPGRHFKNPRYGVMIQKYHKRRRETTFLIISQLASSVRGGTRNVAGVYITPNLPPGLKDKVNRLLETHNDSELLAVVESRNNLLIFGLEAIHKSTLEGSGEWAWSKSYAQLSQTTIEVIERAVGLRRDMDKFVRIDGEVIYVESAAGPRVTDIGAVLHDLQLFYTPQTAQAAWSMRAGP